MPIQDPKKIQQEIEKFQSDMLELKKKKLRIVSELRKKIDEKRLNKIRVDLATKRHLQQ